MKGQRINKVIRPDPLGTLNICSKFHSNPANIYQDISLKIQNVKLMIAIDEKSQDHLCQFDSSSGEHNCLYQMSQQSIL